MANRNDHTTSNGLTTAGAYRDEAEHAAHTAAQKARDLAATAQHKADAGIHAVAGPVSHAAETVRERSDAIAGVTADAGLKVADELDHTADYLREGDSQKLIGDVQRYAKAHPVQAIAGAVFGLFLLRRLMH